MLEVHGLEELVGHVLGVLVDLDLEQLGLLFQVALVVLCQEVGEALYQGVEEVHDLEQAVYLDLVAPVVLCQEAGEALYQGVEEAHDPVVRVLLE